MPQWILPPSQLFEDTVPAIHEDVHLLENYRGQREDLRGHSLRTMRVSVFNTK